MDLENAQKMLLEGDYTCVLQRGSEVYTSTLRGVKPLVQWLESDLDLSGFSAADKVIGKATAYLYVLLGVKDVYAHVISKSALEVLTKHGVSCRYGELTENIINRRGDGICPVEEAVMEIHEPQEAFEAVLKKMQEMKLR